MLIRAEALLCATRAHGEHGAIVRVLTADHGLVAGYVAGARGRTLRPVLIPGNSLAIELRARGGSQLPAMRTELVTSRAPWLAEPLPAAAIGWVTALTAAALPEGQPSPALHLALGATLDAVCHAPSARGWVRAVLGYEALMLREAGHGAMPQPGTDEDWATVMARLTRHEGALSACLLADLGRRHNDVMAARTILVERLRRIDQAD